MVIGVLYEQMRYIHIYSVLYSIYAFKQPTGEKTDCGTAIAHVQRVRKCNTNQKHFIHNAKIQTHCVKYEYILFTVCIVEERSRSTVLGVGSRGKGGLSLGERGGCACVYCGTHIPYIRAVH